MHFTLALSDRMLSDKLILKMMQGLQKQVPLNLHTKKRILLDTWLGGYVIRKIRERKDKRKDVSFLEDSDKEYLHSHSTDWIIVVA